MLLKGKKLLSVLSKRIQNSKTKLQTTEELGLMVQGAQEETIWKVCAQGFLPASIKQSGFYGAGSYFTNDIQYALDQTESSREDEKCFVVSLVAPGDSFPITEHPFKQDSSDNSQPNPTGFLGKDLKEGYDSHFTIVKKHFVLSAFPIDEPLNFEKHAEELVIFQSQQAYPLFVVVVRD